MVPFAVMVSLPTPPAMVLVTSPESRMKFVPEAAARSTSMLDSVVLDRSSVPPAAASTSLPVLPMTEPPLARSA